MDRRTALKGVEKMENVSEYDNCPDQDWERQLEEVRLILLKVYLIKKHTEKRRRFCSPVTSGSRL